MSSIPFLVQEMKWLEESRGESPGTMPRTYTKEYLRLRSTLRYVLAKDYVPGHNQIILPPIGGGENFYLRADFTDFDPIQPPGEETLQHYSTVLSQLYEYEVDEKIRRRLALSPTSRPQGLRGGEGGPLTGVTEGNAIFAAYLKVNLHSPARELGVPVDIAVDMLDRLLRHTDTFAALDKASMKQAYETYTYPNATKYGDASWNKVAGQTGHSYIGSTPSRTHTPLLQGGGLDFSHIGTSPSRAHSPLLPSTPEPQSLGPSLTAEDDEESDHDSLASAYAKLARRGGRWGVEYMSTLTALAYRKNLQSYGSFSS
ncbi:hypothetical protein K402DRAFT_467847 [Aulographum hederae CBS 113979]|uniref:Uncharacterized protein n=1 Tax=Aulographum hederae CBS 113979 TaxID=1176131 RepID=A0A6G1GJN3_9PEZI|nr:hypothetical protein K402DRAFT_467847 [Aulographum hederae CBS 113979]